MSSARTFLCAGGLALGLLLPAFGLSAAEARTLPRSPSQQVQLFATCAGRLSALMEHQWMFDGPGSERTEARRDGFVELVDATLPDAVDWGMPETRAMGWRVSAKAQQRALLGTARFGMDPGQAKRAARAAEARLAECDLLTVR